MLLSRLLSTILVLHMNEDLQNLIAIQEIDTSIDKLVRQENELRASLGAEKQAVAEREGEVEAIKARSQECVKLVHDLENDVRELDESIAKHNSQLNDVNNNREYATMQVGITAEQEKKGKLEEQIIKEMEKADAVKQEVAAAEALVEEAKKVLQAKQATQDEKIGVLAEERKNEEAARGNASEKMRKLLAHKYDQTRAARGGMALAEIQGGCCQGCHISLPPQLVIEVRKGDELLDCYSCGRILYIND